MTEPEDQDAIAAEVAKWPQLTERQRAELSAVFREQEREDAARREQAKDDAARRALDDPAKLERAAQIVRAALARKRAAEAAGQEGGDVPAGEG